MAQRRLIGLAGSLGAAILRRRSLVRAPIGLYRRGLGWMFGSRLCMIEHVGRKSGEARFVAVEVVEAADRGVVVASGYGTRSQWYRNIVAQPRVFLSIGRIRRRRATAVPLTPDESAAALDRYTSRHPITWRFLEATFAALETAHPDSDSLRLVRIDWA